MTEQGWLGAKAVEPMLEFLHGRPNDRKLRLFVVACCRQIDHLLVERPSREVVAAAEYYADGLCDISRLFAVGKASLDYIATQPAQDVRTIAAAAVNATIGTGAWAAAWNGVSEIRRALGIGTSSLLEQEASDQASLLRHIFGNPFKPYPSPESWPSTVMQLAASLYEGHDCRLPLSDALEESGHGELAMHFREEEWHPKGCYAMDLIFGKE